MTAGSMARKRRVAQTRTKIPTPALEWIARLGFTARGVTYFLIGLLALAIAAGKPAPAADRSGALQVVGDQPYGKALLWLLVIGFGAMVLWRLAQVLYGVDGTGHHGAAEAISLCRAALYAAFCVGTLRFVQGHQLPQSTDQQSQDFTAKAMGHTGGRALVAVAGLIIVVIGAYMIWQGVTKRFLKDLQLGGASARARTVVKALGTTGNVARGVVFAGLGIFLVAAAVRFDPHAAKGIDSTLRTFAHTPLGPWLLAVVAVGLAVFGLYSFCEARWHKHV